MNMNKEQIFKLHNLACNLVDITRDLNHQDYCGDLYKDEAKIRGLLDKLKKYQSEKNGWS